MKKLFLLPVLGMILFVTSCDKNKSDDEKKEDATPTLILGKWQFDYYADDDNYNDIIDADEKYPEESAISEFYFFEDGTALGIEQYQVSYPVDSTFFTYSVSADGKNITIIDTDDDYPVYLGITELTSNTLILKATYTDNNQEETSWTALKR